MKATLKNILSNNNPLNDDWWYAHTIAYGPDWDNFPYPLSKIQKKLEPKDWNFFILNLEIIDEYSYQFKNFVNKKEYQNFEKRLQNKYDLWFINWEEGAWNPDVITG